MTFAILLRSQTLPDHDTVLAYDFDHVEQAVRFARGLAWSYAEHGTGTERNTYWFRDGAGRHELKVV